MTILFDLSLLMYASEIGCKELGKELIEESANPFLRTGEGKTALDYAGNDDIKSLLENIVKKE